MHVWDEYDVFGDSIYSQNVKDRIDDERGIIEKEKKTWFTELFKSRRKTDFLDLFDFALTKWIENEDTRVEKIFTSGLTLKKLKEKEEDFFFAHNKNFVIT